MRHSGSWSEDEAERFLEASRIPLRVAVQSPSGHPWLTSLWYLVEDGKLWCATQQGAFICKLLTGDPRCGFEVSVESPPYRGVRGSAHAVFHPRRGEEVLRRLIDRYLGDDRSALARQLLAKAHDEVAIELDPRKVVSWDYTQRMKDVS